MRHLHKSNSLPLLAWLVRCLAVFLLLVNAATAGDSLPSWNDTAPKQAIVRFVEQVSTPGSPAFVPLPERIATFDTDGTLWSEQPSYAWDAFAFDRIKALAPQNPSWAKTQPFKAVLEDDMASFNAGGGTARAAIMAAVYAGESMESITRMVTTWLATARNPKTGHLYTDMVYQPMQELLRYLRANGFKTYIVSGSGQEFLRPWSEKVFGIPPEQVIGSVMNSTVEWRNGQPVVLLLPTTNMINDGDGKVIGIDRFMGRRPIAAFGNSDGDLPMLHYATAGPGVRFGLLVHHTDAAREFAYDKDSPVGRLDKGLQQAQINGWTVVDMKRDWQTVFAGEKN
jgi:phosphoserine phosphatase